mmetsp:Transcript_16479/g.29588  ORF Transcript_16479/g.29588 Transcript_16479/m.29588 type:complete len:137 (-) Transcript_16479:251-661(-)|eukprot:CAMPEP_0197514972 /NCGR_PEP_ID=MMETSP1318-20131121/243_1 /TAXON_ID=552666 /ORGANISM="Partenskyella glossopodia, Strain RCC365" /LENGTH=136 /DNA_ID=CAMNT_0043063209 /DNA_START=92 /DNA_END=502 /DNA_ORIENTATION=-
MTDKGPYANMRGGRFSIPKFSSLPSDLTSMREMSDQEKDAYVAKKLHEHKRALYREYETARTQAILEAVISRCFAHCVLKPDIKENLTRGQKHCLTDCSADVLDYNTSIMGTFVERSKHIKGLKRAPGPAYAEDWK